MDALTRAHNNVERSYHASKASASEISRELLARTPRGGITQRDDYSRASVQLEHFRGWVYASIRPIAQKIAGQAILVGKRKSMRRRKSFADFEPFDSHELLDLFGNPNPLMTSWSLMFSTVASLELTGRSLWWFASIQGREVVFPIPSSWIVDIGGSISRDTFFVRPPRHMGEPIPLPAAETCYFTYPHPGSPHGVCSPLQACAMAVEADESIQWSQRSTFQQGINPRHALIVGGKEIGGDGKSTGVRVRLTAAQRSQLIDAVREVYQGVHKHGEPLILDALINDVKTLSNRPDEMDFMDSGKQTKQRIMQCFGTNPIIAGEIEGANRASSLSAEEHFAEFTVNPKIRLISETLTTTVGPRFGDVGIWIESIKPNDVEMDLRRMDLLAKHGALLKNELREWAGLPADEIFDMDLAGNRRPTAIESALRESVHEMVLDSISNCGDLALT